MATAKLSEQDIRLFLMEKKELNPLLRGVRWSTEDIDAAVNRCIDFWNETPPFINPQTPSSFPYKYTLLIGVAGHLLKSATTILLNKLATVPIMKSRDRRSLKTY